MSTFIVRVQFKNESKENYENLMGFLLSDGFEKHAMGENGNCMLLPNGNYKIKDNSSSQAILDRVLSFATRIEAAPMVLVVESTPTGISARNLHPIQCPPKTLNESLKDLSNDLFS